MLRIILQKVAASLVEQREQCIESANISELHNVLISPCFVQSLLNEIVVQELLLEVLCNDSLSTQKLRSELASCNRAIFNILEWYLGKVGDVIGDNHCRRNNII